MNTTVNANRNIGREKVRGGKENDSDNLTQRTQYTLIKEYRGLDIMI